MGRKVGERPKLSRDQALQMMDELIEAYSQVDFQKELHRAWEAVAGDASEQGRVRQAVCLKVQGPIIERYGFEPSRRGVALSVTAFSETVNPASPFEEEWVKKKCELVGWLVNPDQQKADEGKNLVSQGQQGVEEQEVDNTPDTYPVPFFHMVPERPVQFGGFMGGVARAPACFLALPAEAVEHMGPLMDYLRQDPEGPFAGLVDDWPVAGITPPGRWGRWGFDVGTQGKEQLLKADWHCVHGWGDSRRVFVPRLGDSIGMRRAPPRILAFMESFREVNQHVWQYLLNTLEEAKNREDSSKTLRWLIDVVCHVIRERGFFGAIEAQVWWGPNSTPTRSHKDGATSLLHLAITLSGSRTLRTGTFEREDSFGPSPWVYNRDEWARWQRFQNCDDAGAPSKSQVMKENNVWDDKAWKDKDLRKVAMTAGNVYLSAPFIFEHGVMYDQCTRHNPIIALQCRTAFQFERYAVKVNEMRDANMLFVTRLLAHCLNEVGNSGWLRLPSLKEVMNCERAIKAHLAGQAAAIAGGRFQPLFPPMASWSPQHEGMRPQEPEEPEVADGQDPDQAMQEALERRWEHLEQALAKGQEEEIGTADPTPIHIPDDSSGQWEHAAWSAEGPSHEEQAAAELAAAPEEDTASDTWWKLEARWQEDEELEQQLAEVRRRAAESLKQMGVDGQSQPQPARQGQQQQPLHQALQKPNAPTSESGRERAIRIIEQSGHNHRDIEPHMPDAQIWVAVGGADTGGIMVRKDQNLSSEKLRTKLATGAVVEEMEVVGHRLHYRRLKGEGPDYGWVTIVTSDKVLMERI